MSSNGQEKRKRKRRKQQSDSQVSVSKSDGNLHQTKKKGKGKSDVVEKKGRKKQILEEITTLSQEIRQNRKAVNGVAVILQYLRTDEKEDDEVIFHALRHLSRSFSHLLLPFSSERILEAISFFKKNEGKEEEEEKIPTAEDKYIYFIYERILRFNDYSLHYLKSPQPSIQVAAVKALLLVVQIGSLKSLRGSIISRMVETIVSSKSLSEPLLQSLVQSRLAQHGDLLLSFVSSLKKVLRAFLEGPRASEEKNDQVIGNVWPILRDIPVPTPHLIENKFFTQDPANTSNPQQDLISQETEIFSGTKRKRDFSSSFSSSSSSSSSLDPESKIQLGKLKKKMNQSFLIFFRLPLPKEIFKSVLVRIHADVFPKLTQPVALCDFLTDSYNSGGVISLLALNGIFVLMTKYHLDYPKFYDKLYRLFTPTICYMKHRSQFFSLSSLFLSSRHIPASILAAFLKRMARLALLAPPHSCLTLLAMIYNMMVRHPGCRELLHREEVQQGTGFNSGSTNSTTEEEEDVLMLGSSSTSSSTVTPPSPHRHQKLKEGDPFREEAILPEESNALDSSLWEIVALRQHYCPTIARFVRIFEKSPSEQRKPVELSDFFSNSYSSLIETEIKKQTKNIPLEHEIVKDEDFIQSFSMFEHPVFNLL